MRLGLDGVFNRTNQDGVFHDGDDDAPCGEIYNDFLAGSFGGFLRCKRLRRDHRCEKERQQCRSS